MTDFKEVIRDQMVQEEVQIHYQKRVLDHTYCRLHCAAKSCSSSPLSAKLHHNEHSHICPLWSV